MTKEIWTVMVEGYRLDEICQRLGGADFGKNNHVRAASVGDLFEERDLLEKKIRKIESTIADTMYQGALDD